MSKSTAPPPGSPFVGTSETAARMRAVEWAATPVGPVADWPASLRAAVGICLSSRHPMAIWWGPELVLFYNDACIPILGPSKHPALGRPGAEVWPEMWHIVGKQLQSVLDTGEATWSDDQLLPADRFGYLEEAYFTYSHSAIRDERGLVAGAFTAVTETTGRVLGERRLATLRRLGELSAVGAAGVADACAAALDVVATNRADVPFAEVHLLDEDGARARLVAACGVRPGSRIAPPTLPDPDRGHTLWRVATTGRGETATGLVVRYPGGIESGASPVGEAPSDAAVVLPLTVPGRDAPIGVITMGVSPYRALDEEYRSFLELVAGHVSSAAADAAAYDAERRRAEALAELDRAKTEFFSNISHEFRTPLTLMLGPVEELRAAPTLDEERVRADLDVVHRNGLRLRKMVNVLLDFSRLQAGRARATFRPVDLAAVTRELAGLFAEPAHLAGLALAVDCPELGEPVWVDREMWEQVVLNLLSNAVKFTFDGAIAVRLRRAAGSAVLTVSDTGGGIPAVDQPLLFERFHRVGGTRARSAEGSGIGLALVRELVALHGGTVAVESEVDVGTTFSVTVPFGHAHLPPGQVLDRGGKPADASGTAASVVSETRRWLTPEVQPPEPADQGRPKVLVVDDNADMRAYLTSLLAPHYRVRTAGDGRAALTAATVDVPDLVISDGMMPAMDGVALLAALRADPRTAGVPVLLVSARAGEEAAAEGLVAGADDYLVKPFSAVELLARVRAHLQSARSRRREAAWRSALVEALLDGFYVMDDQRTVVEVNEGFRTILGYGPEDIPQRAPYPWWPDPQREPAEHRQVVEGFRPRSGRVVLPMRHRDGRRVWCNVAYSTVTDPGTGRESRVGTFRDVTAEYEAAEKLRGRAAADRTARDAAEGVNAQLRALVEGLAAVVWEADARTWEVSFISERVEEVLGYPVRDWMADEGFWPSLIDPRDRERVLDLYEHAVATGEDFELVYRATAADGRTVWLQDLIHVLHGADGTPARLQGVMIDITQQERTRQASALLAEVGRLQAEPGGLVDGLAALLRAAVPALADLGVVSLLGPDGLLAPVAAARPGRAEVEQSVLGMPAYPLPPLLEDAYGTGRPFVVQTPTDAELRELSAGETDYEGRRRLGIRSALVVPLEAAGRLLGTLSFVSTERGREHDAADLALAGELGQRAAVAIERARLATRERHLVELTAALAAAGTVAEAARALVDGIVEVLDATAGAAYLAHPAHGMRIVHSSGYPDVILANYSSVRLDTDGPVADCARERRPVWLRDDDDWAYRYPHLLAHHATTGNIALMVMPLVAAGRVVGVMAASFGTRRDFDVDERRFAETIAVQAAQAFERAALADVRREIAETLQHSLLPPPPPAIARMALATCYLPGAHGTQAGGDWYDVLPLADENADRVAVVVGDVVGQGATAAAVMGQLRSVLAAALLDGLEPADALAHLDRFARRLDGARASTVACTVLDTRTGELCWARAGHPPPLVLDGAGPRYLDGGAGSVLGAPGAPGFPQARDVLAPGSTLVLYTDGLVERRGEPIDDGLARLAAAAAAAGPAVPEQMVTEILHRTLHPAGPPDDVALIVARLLPAPLHTRLPARPDQLRLLRREVAAWADAAALPVEATEDLQLAVGEAAANAVEHAYADADGDGEFVVELSCEPGRQVAVRVRDFGRWRPAPADKGFRGRGVDLVRLLGTDVVLDPGPGGTTVEFRLSATRSAGAAAPGAPARAPGAPGAHPAEADRRGSGPAALRDRTDDGRRHIELAGDLDLAGVGAVREPLLTALAGARGPVTLDLTALEYLASAGVGLLAEALGGAAGPVEVLSPAAGPVRAVLDLVRLPALRA